MQKRSENRSTTQQERNRHAKQLNKYNFVIVPHETIIMRK